MIVVLLVGVEVLAFLHSRERHAELAKLMRETERTTYLIGDLGHHLSRMHANVLEAVTDPSEDVAVARERVDSIDDELDELVLQIPPQLSTRGMGFWRAAEPKLALMRSELRLAFAEVEDGRPADAERRLDDLRARIRELFDDLRGVMAVNQRGAERAMAEAGRLMARARWVQLSLGLALTLAIGGIAWQTLAVLRRRERDVDRHLARVERANRDLEAFAGRVAHDLRNVLAPLPVCSSVLDQCAGDRVVVRETAARIERVGRRAADLISGLLAFARAGGSSAGAASPVAAQLDAVLEELAPQIRGVGARVEAQVDDDLTVACDPSLLHVVLLNLVSNAVKFLEGRERREVTIRCRADGARASIEVEDTGPGIPSALLEHVFEPFFRAPDAGAGGDGIGLATVSRIVEAHQGEVRALSVEGVGSTFRVLLPAGPPRAEARARAEVSRERILS